MLLVINRPEPAGPPTPAPAAGGTEGWVEHVTTWTADIAHNRPVMTATAAILAALLLTSLISRHRRTRAARTSDRAAITRTDRAITRFTALIATAVLAVGMWGFFGDVLHLHPLVRITLFAFIEMQIVAAFRRARRHLARHGHLGTAVRTVYLLAFGSATLAALDATSAQEAAFRLFAATVAAYMLAEELAEERDVLHTANPGKYSPAVRAKADRRINWALTPERVLVWLRLAEPAERAVGDVDRNRRIARFARTAYRLHLLKETAAKAWRVRLAARALRRQAEAANEHLNLATDRQAMDKVRAHLAFLYQVESGTSRAAVADLSPLGSARRLAITAAPSDTPRDTADDATAAATDTATEAATATPDEPAADANRSATEPATETVGNPRQSTANGRAKRPPTAADLAASDTAKKLAKVVAKYPDAKLADLAKRAGMSPRTASRYISQARAIASGTEDASDDAKERPPAALTLTTFSTTKTPAMAGVNGHTYPKEQAS